MAFNWKKTLGTVAPALATALGGPVAGAALGALAKKLLGDESATENDIALAVQSASPEQLAKLKEIDTQFQTDMAKLGVDLEKISLEDRKSARDMAKTNMFPQIILSALYTIGYIAVLWAFMKGHVSVAESVKSEFNMILGVLTAGQVQIMNFFFGSSAGSKMKKS